MTDVIDLQFRIDTSQSDDRLVKPRRYHIAFHGRSSETAELHYPRIPMRPDELVALSRIIEDDCEGRSVGSRHARVKVWRLYGGDDLSGKSLLHSRSDPLVLYVLLRILSPSPVFIGHMNILWRPRLCAGVVMTQDDPPIAF